MTHEMIKEFEIWLKTGNVKKHNPAICIANLIEVSAYAIRKNLSKNDFFELTDYRQYNEIREKLLGNKIFRISNPNTYRTFEKISKLYADFLKQYKIKNIVEKTISEESVSSTEVQIEVIDNANTIIEELKTISPLNSTEICVGKDVTSVNDHHSTSKELFTKIEIALRNNYPNGFAFSSTAIRLLSELIDFQITDDIAKTLRKFLFRRGDDLYFWPALIASEETCFEFCEQARTWLSEYGCFEIAKLYELYSNKISNAIIKNSKDFGEYFEYIISQEMRSYSSWIYKIYVLPGVKKHQFEQRLAKQLVEVIIESGGIITESDLAEKIPAVSIGLIAEILKCYQKTVIKTEINDIPCYQSFDALGLSNDFSTILSEVINELDKVGIVISEDALHTALSLRIGVNFKNEYNIQDNRTYRQLIAVYYDAFSDSDGSQIKREWNRGNFLASKGGR